MASPLIQVLFSHLVMLEYKKMQSLASNRPDRIGLVGPNLFIAQCISRYPGFTSAGIYAIKAVNL